MDCVCYNVLNNLQRQINSLFITAANNRLNSDSSTTDDGAYRPNLNLVEHGNQNTFFDLNTIFYIPFSIFDCENMELNFTLN